MRVLILADACNPDWPSLPGFTYQAIRAIADHADVVVATQVRNGQSINRVGLGRAEVVFLDTEWIAGPLWKIGEALRGGPQAGWLIRHLLDYPGYLAFEWLAVRHFRPALQAGEFDVVHRLTPVTTLLPSYMAAACPVPVVVGPLNDNLPWAPESIAEEARELQPAERLLGQGASLIRCLPYQRATFTHATVLLAAFEHVRARWPDTLNAKSILFPELGINPALFRSGTRSMSGPMTILFVGRLVPYKLPDVLVRAFASSKTLRQHRLLIVGDGPERPLLETLIAEHGLADTVQLLGQQSLAEVAQHMRQADIFAFPSIHELGGGVVVEAMASGMACIVVDYGGPATLIGPERGVKVPLASGAQLVGSFRCAMEQLVSQPERVRQLGRAGHEHAMTYYTWDAKARKTLEVYRWVTGQQATRPNFWAPTV